VYERVIRWLDLGLLGGRLHIRVLRVVVWVSTAGTLFGYALGLTDMVEHCDILQKSHSSEVEEDEVSDIRVLT
jgi:hypothetical protein